MLEIKALAIFLTMLQPHVPPVPGVLVGWLGAEAAGDVPHPSWPHATSQRLDTMSGDAQKGSGGVVMPNRTDEALSTTRRFNK